MMSTKLGVYGSTAGYGATAQGGNLTSLHNMAMLQQSIAIANGQPWDPNASLVERITGRKATSAVPKNTVVLHAKNADMRKAAEEARRQQRAQQTQQTQQSANPFDLRANLATGYSFPTDVDMYGNKAQAPDGTMTMAAVDAGGFSLPVKLAMGAALVGGGYMLYKHFSKSKGS